MTKINGTKNGPKNIFNLKLNEPKSQKSPTK
jgi:hypothetical protein